MVALLTASTSISNQSNVLASETNLQSKMKLGQKSKGIFDRLESKMHEKERALAEYEVEHQKNFMIAQQRAAVIAAGQIDKSI